MTDYLIYSVYQNGTFCLEGNLFYEDNKRLGYSEDEKDGSIVSNNHREVVNRLSELKELNIELKRENKTFRKENEQLKKSYDISEDYNDSLSKENEELHQIQMELVTERDSLRKENTNLFDENEQLKCGNKNLKATLNDFINILNRLQSNPNDKQTLAVARDMLQNMGVDLE